MKSILVTDGMMALAADRAKMFGTAMEPANYFLCLRESGGSKPLFAFYSALADAVVLQWAERDWRTYLSKSRRDGEVEGIVVRATHGTLVITEQDIERNAEKPILLVRLNRVDCCRRADIIGWINIRPAGEELSGYYCGQRAWEVIDDLLYDPRTLALKQGEH